MDRTYDKSLYPDAEIMRKFWYTRTRIFDGQLYRRSWHLDLTRRVIVGVSFLLVLSVIESGTTVAAQHEIENPSRQSLLVQRLIKPEISDSVFKLHLLSLTRDELKELTETWLGVTRESVKQTSDLSITLSATTGSSAEAIRADLEKRLKWRNQIFRRLAMILDDWSAKGASKEEVTIYRDYVTAILRTEAHTIDVKTVLKIVRGWAISPDGGLRLFIKIVIFFVSIISLNFIARMLSVLLKRSLHKKGASSVLFLEFMQRTAYWTLFVIGITFALSFMGVAVTPLLAAFGGASFIIGFATQSTLSNFVSGLLLMVNRPFDVGDKVRIAGVSGIVESVTTISTVICDTENRTTIIPNKTVWDNVIINEGKVNSRSQ